MTTIAFDVLPYPDLLPFDEVLDVLGKIWCAEAVDGAEIKFSRHVQL